MMIRHDRFPVTATLPDGRVAHKARVIVVDERVFVFTSVVEAPATFTLEAPGITRRGRIFAIQTTEGEIACAPGGCRCGSGLAKVSAKKLVAEVEA